MSSTSVSITIDEWLAANNARIQKKKEAKRQKMIRRNLKLEKQRKKELENAKRLAEDEARAVEELCPALPRIGSRYPMIHTLTLTLWPAPPPVSEIPGPLAPSYRTRVSVLSASTSRNFEIPAPATSCLPASSTLPRTTPVAAPSARAIVPPTDKSVLKRQILAQKKLQIDMILDEEPLPEKRARKVVDYCQK